MNCVTTHPLINQLISVYYRVGVWNRKDENSPIRLRIKWLYFIYHLYIPISAMIASLKIQNKDESIFLIETSIVNAVLSARFLLAMRKQNQIFELLEQTSTLSFQDEECFEFVNKKLEVFIKATKLFMSIVIPLAIFCVVAPYVGEKELLFKLAFPFDVDKNDFNFFMANAYLFIGILFAFFFVSISILLWYIMFNCSLRYDVLGITLTKMGRMNGESNEAIGISDKQKQNAFRHDLSTSIKHCLQTRKLVCELELFCSTIYYIEIGTSGLGICGSIYCLAFDVSDNNVGRMLHLSSLMYNVAGIFITTYLGNEIMLASDRLTYCLFKSAWYDQPQSTKFIIIILGECLKQPQVMVVAKLYPLTLETFTRILNFAYSSFNILKTFRS